MDSEILCRIVQHRKLAKEVKVNHRVKERVCLLKIILLVFSVSAIIFLSGCAEAVKPEPTGTPSSQDLGSNTGTDPTPTPSPNNGSPPGDEVVVTDSSKLTIAEIAKTIKPGEWVEYDTNGFYIPGENIPVIVPPQGDGYISEYSDEALYDPINEKIYIIGCAQPYTCSASSNSSSRWIQYDVARNLWTVMPHPPFSTSYHTYDHAALDSDTGNYYFRSQKSKTIRLFQNGAWTTAQALPEGSGNAGASALEYFPALQSLIFVEQGNTPRHLLRHYLRLLAMLAQWSKHHSEKV